LDVTQTNADVEEDIKADTAQYSWGGALQLAYQGAVLGRSLSLITGADYAGAVVTHRIASRARGSAESSSLLTQLMNDPQANNEPFTVDSKIQTHTNGGGPFLTLTIEPIPRLTLTLAGRYDVTSLDIHDLLTGHNDGSGPSASGSHLFDRFNPAIG